MSLPNSPLTPSSRDCRNKSTFPKEVQNQFFADLFNESQVRHMAEKRSCYPIQCNEGKSVLFNDDKEFHVALSIGQFKSDEISVKVIDGYIVIRGQHAEKVDSDDARHSVAREFTRRYALPQTCEIKNVKAYLYEGLLMVTAPKTIAPEIVHDVPIVSFDNTSLPVKDQYTSEIDFAPIKNIFTECSLMDALLKVQSSAAKLTPEQSAAKLLASSEVKDFEPFAGEKKTVMIGSDTDDFASLTKPIDMEVEEQASLVMLKATNDLETEMKLVAGEDSSAEEKRALQIANTTANSSTMTESVAMESSSSESAAEKETALTAEETKVSECEIKIENGVVEAVTESVTMEDPVPISKADTSKVFEGDRASEKESGLD